MIKHTFTNKNSQFTHPKAYNYNQKRQIFKTSNLIKTNFVFNINHNIKIIVENAIYYWILNYGNPAFKFSKFAIKLLKKNILDKKLQHNIYYKLDIHYMLLIELKYFVQYWRKKNILMCIETFTKLQKLLYINEYRYYYISIIPQLSKVYRNYLTHYKNLLGEFI